MFKETLVHMDRLAIAMQDYPESTTIIVAYSYKLLRPIIYGYQGVKPTSMLTWAIFWQLCHCMIYLQSRNSTGLKTHSLSFPLTKSRLAKFMWKFSGSACPKPAFYFQCSWAAMLFRVNYPVFIQHSQSSS